MIATSATGRGIGDGFDGRVQAGRAHRVSDHHVLDLGHGADAPGGEVRRVVVVLSLELKQVVEPDLPAPGQLELLVGLDRPGEDAEHRDPAHERVGHGLEDIGEHRPVDRRGEAVAGGKAWDRALQGVGPVVDDELGEQVDADQLLRRGDDDRVQGPVEDAVVDRRHDLFSAGLGPLEVRLHHGVVGLDDGFDQGGVRRVDPFFDIGRKWDFGTDLRFAGIGVGPLEATRDHAGELVFGTDRDLDRGDCLAECLAQLVEGPLER